MVKYHSYFVMHIVFHHTYVSLKLENNQTCVSIYQHTAQHYVFAN